MNCESKIPLVIRIVSFESWINSISNVPEAIFFVVSIRVIFIMLLAASFSLNEPVQLQFSSKRVVSRQ